MEMSVPVYEWKVKIRFQHGMSATVTVNAATFDEARTVALAETNPSGTHAVSDVDCVRRKVKSYRQGR